MLGAALSQGGLVPSASAHGGGGAEDAAEHAQQDLVGVSVEQVEAMTAARRAQLLAADPRSPGLATARSAAADALQAASNPGVDGRWERSSARPWCRSSPRCCPAARC